MSSPSISTILRDSNLPSGLRVIAEKVEAPLGYLGSLANHIRERKHGDKTYFNRNFHVEPTNVCLYTCTFCSYSRRIKKREDGWEYSLEDIMAIVKGYDDKPVTEVHIVGGVLPQYDVPFYAELFSQIREHRPDLHVKALTPVEYHYIFKKAKISYLKFATRSRAVNAQVRNGYVFMKSGMGLACALTRQCSTVTSKSSVTE